MQAGQAGGPGALYTLRTGWLVAGVCRIDDGGAEDGDRKGLCISPLSTHGAKVWCVIATPA